MRHPSRYVTVRASRKHTQSHIVRMSVSILRSRSVTELAWRASVLKTTAKHLLAGAAVALVTVGPVRAADLGPPAVRPSAAIPWSWSGFYLGGHVGAALTTTDVADPFGTALFGDQVRSPGFLAGGQVGYNYQLGSVVFGIEGDASWATSDGTNTCFAVSGQLVSSNCRVRPDFYATLTGRLGYAAGRSLLYAKGGAAW